MQRLRTGALTLAFAALAANAAVAQQPAATGGGHQAEALRPRLGLGFQTSWPAWGLSGMYDFNQRVSGQAVLGFLGGWTTFSARGLYHFGQQPQVRPYGYGMLGFWRYSVVSSASAFTFGAGGGIDVDLRKFAPELPPLYANAEFGISMIDLAVAGYTGATMAFGAGLHYRF